MEEILFLEWEDYKNNRPESRVWPLGKGFLTVEGVHQPSLFVFLPQRSSIGVLRTRLGGGGTQPAAAQVTSRGLPWTHLSLSS